MIEIELTLREDEAVIPLPDGREATICLQATRLRGGRYHAVLGIDAPPGVLVLRSELLQPQGADR